MVNKLFKVKAANKKFLKKRYNLINILYNSTGIPFNTLDGEIGSILDYCINHHYTDKCTLGALFGHLWANHINNFAGDADAFSDNNFL